MNKNTTAIQSKKFIQRRKRKHNELTQPIVQMQTVDIKPRLANRCILINSRIEPSIDSIINDKSIIKVIFDNEYMQDVDLIMNIYSCVLFICSQYIDEYSNLQFLFNQINRIYFKFDEIYLISSGDKKVYSIITNYVSKQFDMNIVKVISLEDFTKILKFHDNIYEANIPIINRLMLEFNKYPYLNPLEVIYFYNKFKTSEIVQKYHNRNISFAEDNIYYLISRLSN
jgi:hypothetical protein